jgi:hypothetical protein
MIEAEAHAFDAQPKKRCACIEDEANRELGDVLRFRARTVHRPSGVDLAA